MNFSRLIVLLVIVVYTNVFGLLKIGGVGGLQFRDLLLLVLVCHSFHLVLNNRRLLNFTFKGEVEKYFIWFLGIVVLTSLSMIFRDTGNLGTGIKIGRSYFILLLFVPICKDILNKGSDRYWFKLILAIGLIYSFVVYLNFVIPSIAQSIFTEFSYMHLENAWDTSSTRRVVKSNYGILFIHLAFILQVLKKFKFKERISFLELFLFGAMFLQGWRAILISIIFSLCLLLLSLRNRKYYIKKLSKSFFVLLIVSLPINLVYDGIISSKFVSTFQEVTGEKDGTLSGRLNRAEIYVIPKFLEKPYFGYGFISEKHKREDIDEDVKSYDKTEMLYNFDFGHLTLLIMFGAIGFTAIIGIFLKSLYVIYKKINQEGLPVGLSLLFIFFLSLIIANYSFGGLISYTGLLPLGIVLGVSQGDIYNSSTLDS